MPTNQNAYNTRLTDEALEKKFRDTFRSQGGAELVDDLYASGVIIPVVDFTSAAEGSALRQDLQSAWDFATGDTQVSNTTATVISTPGFWKVDLNYTGIISSATSRSASLQINDGSTDKKVWDILIRTGLNDEGVISQSETFTVFLRSGDSLTATTNAAQSFLSIWYRQIADVSGNLTNPLGFTSS